MEFWFGGAEVPEHRTTLGRAGVRRAAVNLAPILKQRSGGAGPVETMEPFAALFYASQADLNPDEIDRFLESLLRRRERLLRPPDALHGALRALHPRMARSRPRGGHRDGRRARRRRHPRGPGDRGPHEPHADQVPAPQLGGPLLRQQLEGLGPPAALRDRRHRQRVGLGAALPRAAGVGRHQGGPRRQGARGPRRCRSSPSRSRTWAATSRPSRTATCRRPRSPWPSPAGCSTRTSLLRRTLSGCPTTEGDDDGAVATRGSTVRRTEQVPIPIVRFDESGTMAGVIGGSFRQCDACLLADLCPKFEPGAYCAFTVDVEIRDTDQAMAAMSTLIEIQVQRAQRAAFAEEVLGQGPQPRDVGWSWSGCSACSSRCAGSRRTARRSPSMRRRRATVARCRRSFGPRVGSANKELSTPVNVDAVIAESGIIDVDDA